jgi:hypothetical protein
VINEKPLKYASISGIVFPTLLVMMFPEGTTIFSIANVLITLFSGFFFIVTILSGCGQKEVPKLEEHYDIPLFEAFASSFGDEYAIVWKKTNGLVDIPGNNGKLTYTDAHRILNDYLKQNPDEIWGVQIIPRVEIVTHILPVEETEANALVGEVEEILTTKEIQDSSPDVKPDEDSLVKEVEVISMVEDDKDLPTTDESEDISQIEEIDESPVEDTEEIVLVEDTEQKTSNEIGEDISPTDETEEITMGDDSEDLSLVEDMDSIAETEVMEEIIDSPIEDIEEIFSVEDTEDIAVTEGMVEISSVEDEDDLAMVNEIEDFSPIEGIEEAPVKESEEISPVDDTEQITTGEDIEDIFEADITEDLATTDEIEEISTTEDLDDVTPEKNEEPKFKGKLLSNLPDPYIILGSTEELDKTNDVGRPKVELVEEGHGIAWTKDKKLVDIPSNDGSLTYIEAHQVLEEFLVQNPEKTREIRIIPNSEIVKDD